MKGIVEDLKYRSGKFGLSTNMTKTKFMANGEGISEFWFEKTKLTGADRYRCLGQSSKFTNNMNGIIRERISNLWKIWKNKSFLKMKIAEILDRGYASIDL